MKSFARYLAVILVTALISGYIGYLYAGYEEAFYCETVKTPAVAVFMPYIKQPPQLQRL